MTELSYQATVVSQNMDLAAATQQFIMEQTQMGVGCHGQFRANATAGS